MPSIEATFVTNTDIVVASARKYTAAPVTTTAATPSPTGSSAASSDPNTTSSTIRIAGNPVRSACARSSCCSSCCPAHSACWPTRYACTPSVTEPTCSSVRRSLAASSTSSRAPETCSGTSTTRPEPGAASGTVTPSTRAAAARTRSIAAPSIPAATVLEHDRQRVGADAAEAIDLVLDRHASPCWAPRSRRR